MGVGRMVRWCVAGLTAAAAFGLTAWLAGAFVLPLVMKSGADRWAVAVGLASAVAAVAGVWGQWWATRESAGPGAGPAGDRLIRAGRDITGIASAGDGATNTQYR
jgi:hypothetical protein